MGIFTKRWPVLVAAIALSGLSLTACGSADRDDAGAVVEEGSVSAWSIRVGDCLTDTFADENSEFSNANLVPCDQPHAFEAYHSEDLSGDTFSSALDAQADDICYFAFEDFIGANVDDTYLTYKTFLPTQKSWEGNNDREVTCIVGFEDGSDITGTLRNSG